MIAEESEQETANITGCIPKAELAMMYFSTYQSGKSAKNALARMINETVGLLDELIAKTSYDKHKHSFTPMQYKIIVKYVGPPL